MLYVDIEKKLDSFTLRAQLCCDTAAIGLLGPSGAGKSMTLKCIAGIERPDRGVIRLGDTVLYDSARHINLPPQKRGVGYLFQNYALFPNMTVEGNINAALRHLPKRERSQRLCELIERFRLTGLGKKRPATLSGGEGQRVALARIFASVPKVLLLDEPFSSLDTLLKHELMAYVKDIISRFGGHTILVSHDTDEVCRLCGEVAVIRDGKVGEKQDIHAFYKTITEEYKEAGLTITPPGE